jgi:hypothetical protein
MILLAHFHLLILFVNSVWQKDRGHYVNSKEKHSVKSDSKIYNADYLLQVDPLYPLNCKTNTTNTVPISICSSLMSNVVGRFLPITNNYMNHRFPLLCVFVWLSHSVVYIIYCLFQGNKKNKLFTKDKQ